MPPDTGAVALAMVKDECDIIEAFVRHTLAHVDHLYLVDDGSDDGTLEILVQLVNEGLPLSVFRSAALHFQQGAALSSLMRQVAATRPHRWFVLLDADEFIRPPPGRTFAQVLAELPEDRAAQMSWMSFVPVAPWQPTAQADLRSGFVADAHEVSSIRKVLVPGALAARGVIGEGNHLFRGDGIAPLPPVDAPVALQHLPVRSGPQIVAKALLGSARLAIKPGRFPGEGGHWDRIAEFVRQRHYRLDLIDLQCIALRYPTIVDGSHLAAARPVGFVGPALALRYGELARPDVCGRLDRYIGHLNRLVAAA